MITESLKPTVSEALSMQAYREANNECEDVFFTVDYIFSSLFLIVGQQCLANKASYTLTVLTSQMVLPVLINEILHTES
jgi:hypothetical protein